MTRRIEARLAELGVDLPDAPAPAANYVPAVISGKMLYVSGQLPLSGGAVTLKGHLGDGVDIEAARDAAKLCAINILAQARAAIGDLDRIARIVKLTGFVSSRPDFGDQPKVINGASDFLVEVLGDKGRHARSAIGVAALPFDAAVEVEAVIELE
ncbi:RidA family protein [Hansschlegelia zhihuaiae]|uniref:RidA family protein n=1 Tax=Hansschlegelia zhihuaiae TaxID=405005 RepID=A0A4Q0MM69_9HYPH|nr:RidA family protein [Hansschlegelia zhihuaiae]RXF74663.1 RidA family protein [Hansschlegelia zhihuaiae]